MIRSFADRQAELLWAGEAPRRLPREIWRPALRRLTALNGAGALEDLRSPPGNRLEALAGDRRGQHSVRINDQWRVCFRWREGDAHDVEICDYH